MADTENDQTATEPWEGYDDASAEELIEAAGRKRSADVLQGAIDYEKASKDRVTVIDALTARLGEVGDGDADDSDDEPPTEVEASKGQPGEIRKGDVVTPASAEDTSARETTGQVAAQETQERIERTEETNEKAAKAQAEGGTTPPSVRPVGPAYAAENRQDRIEVAGHQYRVSEDVEPDPNYVFDTEAALDAQLVDHVAVASSAAGLFLEIDGQWFRFDRDLSQAVAGQIRAGMVAVHY